MCRPTPVHYRVTANKLVRDLLDQNIIKRSQEKRSVWCTLAHIFEKPNRVPMDDFSYLNSCLVRVQAQVFATGEEIRQQLGSDCCVCGSAWMPYRHTIK